MRWCHYRRERRPAGPHRLQRAARHRLVLPPLQEAVQFNDGSQPILYGLIAEEVAEVYPGSGGRSADGQIETVKYRVLDSMLLNELQKQNVTNCRPKGADSLPRRAAGKRRSGARTNFSVSFVPPVIG